MVGIVVDKNMKPVENVVISIVSGPGKFPELAAITNQNGEFEFENLQEGLYSILIRDNFGEKIEKIQLNSNTKEYIVEL